MKKVIVLVSALLVFAGVSFAKDVTPVKVSIFPKLGLPTAQTVHGLDLGLIATKVDEVKGVQLAWIYGGTRDHMIGLSDAFVNSANNMTGLQLGFVNLAENVQGVQFGFVNVTERMQGVQLGLVNVIKQGIIPAMVFINANF